MDETIRLRRSDLPVQWPMASLQCASASATHIGKVRKLNEDACIERPEIGLWAVADGVGGATAGDRASRLVVEALARVEPPASAVALLDAVGAALREVNETLLREGEESGGKLMATTVVALLAFGDYFACAWAGDSRLYLLRDGAFRQITHDHSEVQEMVDRGVLSPEEARNHPRGNVITRAIGADGALVLDKVGEQILAGDVFLLCTDGLTKMLEDSEIAARLSGRPVAVAAQKLIEAALERGGTDNVTLVAVRAFMPGTGDVPAPPRQDS